MRTALSLAFATLGAMVLLGTLVWLVTVWLLSYAD